MQLEVNSGNPTLHNNPNGGAGGTSAIVNLDGSTHLWSTPELIKTIINEDSIELIYKSYSYISTGNQPAPVRIWKDVYACIDGKLAKKETIEGRYIPRKEETFEFD